MWLVGILAVALAGMLWAWREEIEQRVRYMVQGEQMAQALREAESEAARQRKLRKRADDIAKVRKARLEALMQRERDLSDELELLEQNDEEVRKWSDDRLPGAIIDRLREPGANREDGDGGGDAPG